MSSSLGYSEFNNNEKIENKYEASTNRRKTYKNRPKKKVTKENMENFLNLAKNVGNDGDDDGSGLADFTPPPQPILTKQPDELKENEIDAAVSPDEFNELDDSAANQEFYNKFIPYYSEAQSGVQVTGNKDRLFEFSRSIELIKAYLK